MKRKVIQIAGSTQLVSLPRPWAIKYNVKKGDELDIKTELNRMVVSAGDDHTVEKYSVDVSNLGSMIGRIIASLYRKGADEIRIMFDNPELINEIQKSISYETVGFEILDQSKNSCVVKYVTGPLEEFDSLIRRTFLLLLTMADNTYNALKDRDYAHLKSITTLEEANNRFTTICRRRLNKYGLNDTRKIGPIYVIIEDLEKVADQFKYMCQFFSKLDPKKNIIRKDFLEQLRRANALLRQFYELYYKFDPAKLDAYKKERISILDDCFALFKKKPSHYEIALLHWAMNITDKAFCMECADVVNHFQKKD